MVIGSIRFYKIKVNQSGYASIQLQYRRDGIFYKQVLKSKIPSQLWDRNNQAIINDKKKISELRKFFPKVDIEILALKAELEQSSKILTKAYEDIVQKKLLINNESLKKRVAELTHPSKLENYSNVYILEYIKDFVERASEKKIQNSHGRLYEKNSIKSLVTFLGRMNDFFEYTKKDDILIKDIDMLFYDELVNYLFNVKLYEINTVGAVIKFLKLILRKSHEEKLHNNEIYKISAFKKPTNSKTINISLRLEEIEQINNFVLPKELAHMQLTKDFFVVNCFLGLRISDLKRINKNCFEFSVEANKWFFMGVTIKPKQMVKIPLKPMVYDILEKYHFTGDKIIEQKFNEYIKKIGKLCNLSRYVDVVSAKGGRLTTKKEEIYNLLTSSVCRRTLATNLLKEGLMEEEVMKISGHTSKEAFRKYISSTYEFVNENILNSDYLN
jgi:hypothetical protein